MSQATIASWCKDNLRNSIQALKKPLDDMERSMMAAISAEVAEQAKSMIAERPNQPFVVHEFQALTSGKVKT